MHFTAKQTQSLHYAGKPRATVAGHLTRPVPSLSLSLPSTAVQHSTGILTGGILSSMLL